MRDLCEHVTSLLEKLTEFPEKEGEALIKATLGVGVSLEDEYGHVGQKAIETAYNDIMTRLCFCLGNLRVILLYGRSTARSKSICLPIFWLAH